ncbi:MAG: transcriptional regulator [Candidatus Heimdallarchaeaceae archaeon]
MKPFCENMVKYIIPSIRALVARDLIEVHKMTQEEAAKRLGMTQPAVSQYKKHVRGKRAKILETDYQISKKISEMSRSLAKNEINSQEATEDICTICKYIRENKLIEKIV